MGRIMVLLLGVAGKRFIPFETTDRGIQRLQSLRNIDTRYWAVSECDVTENWNRESYPVEILDES